MRPKIVILTLVIAFGILGLAAVFKGLTRKPAGAGEGAATNNQALDAHPADSNQPPQLVTSPSTAAPISDEMRAAATAKEVEQIQDLQGQVDGSNNPVIITALLDKFSNPDVEVRKAALEALRELDDTNAVPGLEKALESTNDPREKVAIMDAIDVIKLPSATANVPPEYATNSEFASPRTNSPYNPNAPGGKKTPHNGNNRKRDLPPGTPVSQPQ
jgi:hypothetical protein